MIWIGPKSVATGICCNSQKALKPNLLSCRLFLFLCVVFTVDFVHVLVLVGVAQTTQPSGHGIAANCGNCVEECQSSGRASGEWVQLWWRAISLVSELMHKVFFLKMMAIRECSSRIHQPVKRHCLPSNAANSIDQIVSMEMSVRKPSGPVLFWSIGWEHSDTISILIKILYLGWGGHSASQALSGQVWGAGSDSIEPTSRLKSQHSYKSLEAHRPASLACAAANSQDALLQTVIILCASTKGPMVDLCDLVLLLY